MADSKPAPYSLSMTNTPSVGFARPASSKLTCQFCRGFPARSVEFATITGFLIWCRRRSWSGILCKECGLSRARLALSHNAAFGWLGLPCFALNLIAIIQNASVSSKLRALDAPQPRDRRGALPMGLPALLRPRFIVPWGIYGLAAGLTWYLPAHISPNQVEVGMCFLKFEDKPPT